MSAHYKVAWLCEALLVSRSGYYHWVERRRQPSPRQLENTHLRERIRQEFARSFSRPVSLIQHASASASTFAF